MVQINSLEKNGIRSIYLAIQSLFRFSQHLFEFYITDSFDHRNF